MMRPWAPHGPPLLGDSGPDAGVDAADHQIERENRKGFDHLLHKGLPPEFPIFRISPLDAVQKFGRRDVRPGKAVFNYC